MIIRKAKLEQHRQLHPSPETDSSGYLGKFLFFPFTFYSRFHLDIVGVRLTIEMPSTNFDTFKCFFFLFLRYNFFVTGSGGALLVETTAAPPGSFEGALHLGEGRDDEDVTYNVGEEHEEEDEIDNDYAVYYSSGEDQEEIPQAKAQTKRKCGACGRTGHNKKTCSRQHADEV